MIVIRSLGRIFSILTPREKLKYIVLVALRSLSSILDIAAIAMVGLLISIGSEGFDRSVDFSLGGLNYSGQIHLGLLLAIVLALFIGKALISLVITKALANFAANVESQAAFKIANKLFQKGLNKFNQKSTSQLHWLLFTSSEGIGLFLFNLAIFISEAVLLVLIGVTLFVINPIISISIIGYLSIVILLLQFVVGPFHRRANSRIEKDYLASSGIIHDIVSAYKELIVYNKMASFLSVFRASRNKLSENASTYFFLGALPRQVIELALILGMFSFIGVGYQTGFLLENPGIVGVFLMGGFRVMGSFLPLSGAYNTMKRSAQQSGEALTEIEDTYEYHQPNSNQDENYSLGIVEDQPEILIENLFFTYPNSQSQALTNVSLSIPYGSQIALVGPSGAGKSTLIEVLLGFSAPESGSVTIGGIRPDRYIANFSGNVAYLPQKPGLISGNIMQNVTLEPEVNNVPSVEIKKALNAAKLVDFIENLPEGAETDLGGQKQALSGGEAQRIGLARAIYSNPKILILDEATSALDATTESHISGFIDSLRGKVTVITVAHRLSTVKNADLVYVIDKGKIIASGDFKTLCKTVPMMQEFASNMSLET